MQEQEYKRQMQEQQDQQNEEQVSEYVEAQQEIHLDNKVINAQTIGNEAVKKLQTELEGRVQKDLDQLTVIANN